MSIDESTSGNDAPGFDDEFSTTMDEFSATTTVPAAGTELPTRSPEQSGAAVTYRVPDTEGDLGLELSTRCRSARDAFVVACDAVERGDISAAESSFYAARDCVIEIDALAHLRTRPFRRLLKLLDAALRRSHITDFAEAQREALKQALRMLCRKFIDESQVTDINREFAHTGVDILGPIRKPRGKTYRVVIEEVTERE